MACQWPASLELSPEATDATGPMEKISIHRVLSEALSEAYRQIGLAASQALQQRSRWIHLDVGRNNELAKGKLTTVARSERLAIRTMTSAKALCRHLARWECVGSGDTF